MIAFYLSAGFLVFAMGFSCGVMWCACRTSSIQEEIADEALKQERGWAP